MGDITEYCEVCGEPKEGLVDNPFGGSFRVRIMCRCDRERAEREESDRARREDDADLERRIRHAFIADSQRSMTFDADDGRYPSEAMETAKAYADKLAHGSIDFGLLMFGPPDSGKTFMSCCIANEALKAGMSVYMRSMPWIIGKMDDRSSREQVRDDMDRCGLLIIDDLGAERSTSYAQELVYGVIDARYQQRRPMVVSTNLTRQELANPDDMESRRIYSRLLEMCLPVEVDTGRKRSTRERYDAMRKTLGIKQR